jgi:four helix bundle protein
MGEQDLRIRTKELALRIIRLYGALPKSTEAQVIGHQLLRSGTSVGANYREAYRARSDAEFVAKVGDCLRELDETTYWLELLADAAIFPADKLALIRNETDQLLAIFTTISKNKKANIKKNPPLNPRLSSSYFIIHPS